MRIIRTSAFVLAALLLLCGLFFRPTRKTSGAKTENYAGVLTLLSPHWEGIRTETERAFNEERRKKGLLPVRFDWLDVGGTSDIIRYIRSNFANKPDGIGVDLLFGGGTDPYLILKDEGLLEPCKLPEEILSKLGKSVNGIPCYDEEGYWYGVGLSGFGILYNKILLKKLGLPEPKSWSDLARPECFSWVASADPRKSGSIAIMYEIIVQAFGWHEGMNLISAICGNTRSYSSSSSSISKDVSIGEAAFGLSIDVYGLSAVMEAGDELLGFVLPEGETVITPDSIAILKGAQNKELAEEFIAFNLSEAGQKLWSCYPNSGPDTPKEFPLLKMSVREDMYEKYPDGAMLKHSPFKIKMRFTYNLEAARGRFSILRDYIGLLFVDRIEDCSKARKNTLGLPDSDPRREAFFHHPEQDEQAFIALASTKYKDTAERAAIQANWSNDAGRRYRFAQQKQLLAK